MVVRDNDTHFVFEQKVDDLDFVFSIPKGSNWAQAKAAVISIHEEIVRQEAQAVMAEQAAKQEAEKNKSDETPENCDSAGTCEGEPCSQPA